MSNLLSADKLSTSGDKQLRVKD